MVTTTTHNLPETLGREILRSEVGSTLHGTGLEGNEDRDEMGIYIEHPGTTIGLHSSEFGVHHPLYAPKHYAYRSAEEEKEEDHHDDRHRGITPRSRPGDLDLTVYSLRKWAALALMGNPSVLLPLYAPEDRLVLNTAFGSELRQQAQWFVSKRAGRSFLGYMQQQRQRMTGDRGAAGRVRRSGPMHGIPQHYMTLGHESHSQIPICTTLLPHGHRCNRMLSDKEVEAIKKAPAVDWKYAMHMLRLGYQGVEYLGSGHITLPIPEPTAEMLRCVRRGEATLPDVITKASELEIQMKELIDYGPLNKESKYAKIETWVIGAHLRSWGYGEIE